MRMGILGLLFFISTYSCLAVADDHLLPHAMNFRLIDHTDRSWELYRFPEAPLIVVAAHSTSSDTVDSSQAAWAKLQTEHPDLRFFYLNANSADTRADLAGWAETKDAQTPILKDTVQAVSRQAGLQAAGDIAIIQPSRDWAIVWRGTISDLDVVSSAIQAITAGEVPPTARPASADEAIGYAAASDVQYARDVAPILQARCVSCHSEGNTGPFSMNSYRKVKGWSEMIEEGVMTKRMPPWHADPAYGHFVNDLSLTADEEQTLLTWIRAGAPKGADEPDPLALAEPDDNDAWHLGEPDVVLEMPRPFDLPATGLVDYQYIHVPTGLTEDKWVRALEVKAGNREVVHHALIFVLYPPEYAHIQPRENEGLNGYFASFLPGALPRPYPEGTGQFLPAGSTFIFQMHYTTMGKATSDQSRMGLYFHDEPPAEALRITAVSETDLKIPPQNRDVEVQKEERFRKPGKIWGLSPHMHYRGSRFRFTAEYPDGGEATLLNIPYYEFDWQPMYLLNDPVAFPEKSRIRVVGAFDNSPTNPRNPDPDKYVRFGRQSFEEMFIGYVMMSEARDPEIFQPRGERTLGEAEETLTAETLVGTKWRMSGFGMQFLEDGKFLSVAFAGKWHVEGNMVYVKMGNRVISAAIMGSRLFYNGSPLTRIE